MYSDIFPAQIPPVPVRFEKKQYQNSTGTAAFFFGEYISKFAILLLFCRAAADSIPTLFPILFRRSVYGILRFCGGFYILIIAQKHCGYQEEILRHTRVRRQFRWRVGAESSAGTLNNLKVGFRV